MQLESVGYTDRKNFNSEEQLAGGEGVALPCPFLKIKKSVLILQKKFPDLFIYELNFSFQVTLFQEISPTLETSWTLQTEQLL